MQITKEATDRPLPGITFLIGRKPHGGRRGCRHPHHYHCQYRSPLPSCPSSSFLPASPSVECYCYCLSSRLSSAYDHYRRRDLRQRHRYQQQQQQQPSTAPTVWRRANRSQNTQGPPPPPPPWRARKPRVGSRGEAGGGADAVAAGKRSTQPR